MDEGFGGDCHNRPSEAQRFHLGCLQAALGFAFACMETTIRHLRWNFRFDFGCLQAALQALPSLAWSCPRYAISDGDLTTAWGQIVAPLR